MSEKAIPHGTGSGYKYHKCRCDECKAWVRKRKRRYREANREAVAESERRYREANREAVAERKRRYREATGYSARLEARKREDSAISAERATHSGMPWTSAEDDVLARENLTQLEKALALGRTVYSVSHRIKILNKKRREAMA